jgi:hypothetical protein
VSIAARYERGAERASDERSREEPENGVSIAARYERGAERASDERSREEPRNI